MKKLKLAALLLALALLCGCSAPAGETTPEPAAATPDPNDLCQIAAGIGRSDTILTVDGENVEAERYLFWLSRAIWDQMYYYGGLTDDASWADAAQELKEDALQTAEMYRIIETRAAQYGVTLSAEEEAQITADLEDNIDQMGGEEEFRAYLDEMCISREGFFAMNRLNYLYWAMEEKLEADGTIAVSDEEVDAFVEENGIYAAKHILISTRRKLEDGSYENFSDDEKAEALALANDLYGQIKASGNREDLFDALMNEYSEDGRDDDGNLYYPQGYTYIYSGQMVPEFEEGALALAVGEVSEPIETAYGYHIILRIPVDREQALAECGPEYKMGTLLDSWMEEAQVTTTKAYEDLDPKAFYDKLSAALEARETAEPQESAAG